MSRGARGRDVVAEPIGPRGSVDDVTGAARRWLAVTALLLRIDARRPASWIAAAACLAVGAMIAAEPLAAALPLVIVCGGLGAVAAAGAADGADGIRWCGGASAGTLRVAWAVGGALAAAVVCRSTTAVALAVTAALTAVPLHVARRRGFVAADVPSFALAVALGVAAVVTLVPEGVRVVVGCACWLTAVALAAWGPGFRGHDAFAVGPPWPGGAPAAAATSPLEWPAMVSTLVAMAVCYFLAPEYAAGYAVLVTGWFLCLAVPAATIAAGGRDAAARGLLVRSAPGRPAVPGTPAHALAVVATQAAILGWPAAVAAVLWGSAVFRPDGPLAAVVVLAALAAVTASVAGVAARRGDGETALAIVAAIAMAGAAFNAVGRSSDPAAGKHPRSTGFCQIAQFAATPGGARRRDGVEGFGQSCETSPGSCPPLIRAVTAVLRDRPVDGVEKTRAAARY